MKTRNIFIILIISPPMGELASEARLRGPSPPPRGHLSHRERQGAALQTTIYRFDRHIADTKGGNYGSADFGYAGASADEAPVCPPGGLRAACPPDGPAGENPLRPSPDAQAAPVPAGAVFVQ